LRHPRLRHDRSDHTHRQANLPPCIVFDITDSTNPYAGPVEGTDGSFCGTLSRGRSAAGTVFRLSGGLRPFVRTLPTFGGVGASVKILGTDQTGATADAVKVVTPGAVLSTNAAFLVRSLKADRSYVSVFSGASGFPGFSVSSVSVPAFRTVTVPRSVTTWMAAPCPTVPFNDDERPSVSF